MPKAKLQLSKLNAQERIALAQNIITNMTGNANFPSPSPSLTVVTGAMTDALTAFNAREAARSDALQKTAILDQKLEALDDVLTSIAAYVNCTCNGDTALILSSGMEVTSPPTPVGPLPAPSDLVAAQSVISGTVRLSWGDLRGALVFEIQVSPDPMSEGSWVSRPNVTRRRVILDGFTPGQRYWFRVRGNASSGPGDWTNPTTLIVV